MFRLLRLLIEIGIVIAVVILVLRYAPDLINLLKRGFNELKYMFQQLVA